MRFRVQGKEEKENKREQKSFGEEKTRGLGFKEKKRKKTEEKRFRV
jgi:hypothetical protein